jgi:two-component system sensor histidine kinase PhoQ
MKSLGSRLLVTLGILLALGFGLTLAALDFSFRARAERARDEVLDAHVVALIAGAEFDRSGRLAPPDPIAEPRLATPGSGLVLQIHLRRGAETWRSPSGLGLTLHFEDDPRPGERRSHAVAAADGTRFRVYSLGVAWDAPRGRPREYVFTAVESLEPYFHELARLRVELLAGFAAFTAVLLAAVLVSLRVLLRPLRRIEAEIAAVEAGQRERLGEGWPRELEGVAHNLNALLGTEQQRLARYRNVVGDLAHSLKTPLSVMRGALAAPDGAERGLLAAQVERIEDIVRHQLQRAAATAPAVGIAALPVEPPLRELAAALAKVHAARALTIQVDVDTGLAYPMDRGDLLEVAGNLADNACKWARSHVCLSARAWLEPRWRRPGLLLEVADDGPGIPDADLARVRTRGVRLDERVPGHGLGLAMVEEVVRAHGGELALGRSGSGGLAATIRLPGA